MELENSLDTNLYIENSETNYINIGYTQASLGTLSSIVGKKVTKSSGASFLTSINTGEMIKIDSEVRRVERIESANVLYVTRLFSSAHTTPTIYKDSYSNNTYSLSIDNFNNPLTITDLNKTQNVIEGCTVFSGLTSLFLFDSTANHEDRRESLITGTYDITTNTKTNIEDAFIFRPNKTVGYIVNMAEFVGNLDLNNQATVTTKQANVYAVWLNGRYLSPLEYAFIGDVITVTSSKLRGFNYIRVLHFPAQSLSGITVKLKLTSYDTVFNMSTFTDLYKLNLAEGFSTTINYEYYDNKAYDIKQMGKVKLNSNNTLSLTMRIGTEVTDPLIITKYLNYYLTNKEKFRIIKVPTTITSTTQIEYYNNCRLLNGNSLTDAKEGNTVTYSIEFQSHVKYAQDTWGSNLFGLTKWAIVGEIIE